MSNQHQNNDQNERIINIFKIIGQYIAIAIICGIVIYYFVSKPSDELINQVKSEFSNTLQKKDINRIIVFMDDEFGKGYKIEIVDKDIINRILNASKTSYGKAEHRGGFAQHYLIRLDMNGVFYNYGYVKMDNNSSNFCTQNGINKYGDCGRIHLLKDTHSNKELCPIAYQDVIDLINIDLIPVLREYVDKKKDENPEKYRFSFENQ